MHPLLLSCGFSLSIITAFMPIQADETVTVSQVLTSFEEAWKKPLPINDPRFGTERVLSLLDLDQPALKKVKDAATAKDYPRAERELLEYFRARYAAQKPSGRKLDPRQAQHANDALRHHFRGNGDVFPPIDRGADIDWTGRAFVEGKEVHDAEWYFQFQRMTWWPALVAAYDATADERYFFEWRYEMVDWAESLLPFAKTTPHFVTRGMETGARCANHIAALPTMLRSPHFDARTLMVFLASFHDQADHIPKVYAKTGNHRLADLSQVFRNGVAFPEFRRSEAWRNDALTLLPKMIDDDVYDDGMNKELIFSYHGMYIGLFVDAWEMFRKHGYADKLPAHFYQKILKMADIYAMQSFPDFTICQFGDAWKNTDAGRLFERGLAPLAKDIPYHQFMVSRGKSGAPPAKTSIAYPQSGFYFFRSDWKPDAVFLALKCGETAFWHNQPDNGSFELYAYGRNLMTDSGCYLYGSSDPEDQRWRAWFRSTKAHQTLTLDGKDTLCAPIFRCWCETEDGTALVVENQSAEKLRHRRTVLFIDRRYVVIHDEALGVAAGDVRVHFQFVPCEAEIDGSIARTKFADGANLQVKTFSQQQELITEKEEGWISYQIRKKQERPAWSWKTTKRASDAAVSFLTVLEPYRQGAKAVVDDLRVEVDGDQRRFTWNDDGKKREALLDITAKTFTINP